MLHRTKKERDANKDKWIGVGGKFLEGESPEECVRREVKEETGLDLISLNYRGIVTFCSDCWETEYMHLFTSDAYQGEMIRCNEGELQWVEKSQIYTLPIWEGDRIFLRLLEEESSFFSLKLQYEGEHLVYAAKNGMALPL